MKILILALCSAVYAMAARSEFLRYDSTNEPKAKSVRFTIDYPATWLAEAGDRPNVVHKFTSEKGKGLEVATIVVKNLALPPGHKVSEADIAELYSIEALSAMLPQGASVLKASETKIDGTRCGYVFYLAPFERANVEMLSKNETYVVYHKEKLIFISFMAGYPKGQNAGPILAKRFAAMQPTFQRMATSVVLLDKWK